MARPELPKEKKKGTVQVLLMNEKIDALGGKKACAKLCAEFLESKLPK